MKQLNKCVAAMLLGGLCFSAHAGHFALNNVLAGGYYDGKWLSPSQLRGPTYMWGGEGCQYWYQNGRQGEGVATAIHRDHPAEEHPGWKPKIDGPDFDIQTENGSTVSYPSHTLSVMAAEWNVMPRKAVSMSVNNKQYKELVADFLVGRGLPSDGVTFTRIDKIDLDGNGTDEVVLVGSAHGGKVPFALLRQIQGQYVATSVLSEPSDGKVQELFYADLNGDGRMEVVIGSSNGRTYRQGIYGVANGDTHDLIRNYWKLLK